MKSTITLSILLLTTACFANQKPVACPEVAALQSVGVQHADTSMFGWQVSSDKNNFGTKDVWRFVMLLGPDKSQTEAEAIAKANAQIGSLIFVNGPVEENHSWLCNYMSQNADDHFFGIAGTEPDSED